MTKARILSDYPNDVKTKVSDLENDTGFLTAGSITSTDIANTLGYTPYSSKNAKHYISVPGTTPEGSSNTAPLSATHIHDALTYTPYDASNPTGFITATALTPYLTASNVGNIYITKTDTENTYYPKVGGAITGNVTVTGNITIQTQATVGGNVTVSSGSFYKGDGGLLSNVHSTTSSTLNTSHWTITEEGGNLVFKYNNVVVVSIDSSGFGRFKNDVSAFDNI
jgi:hypothetical protein